MGLLWYTTIPAGCCAFQLTAMILTRQRTITGFLLAVCLGGGLNFTPFASATAIDSATRENHVRAVEPRAPASVFTKCTKVSRFLCLAASPLTLHHQANMVACKNPSTRLADALLSSLPTTTVTFDDGPYRYHQKLSDTLTKHKAKGTFFVYVYFRTPHPINFQIN
jgi:hypothetical protein